MQTWIGAVIILGGSISIALAGMILVRRTVSLESLRQHHEVAGFLIGVVGVAYAVLLAFVVLTVWTQFEDAQTTAAREANALTSLYRLAWGFSAPTGPRLTRLTRAYAQAVVGEEWAATGRGPQSAEHPHAWHLVNELWRTIEQAHPQTPRDQALYAEMLSRLDEMSSERRLRILAARDGVPRLMWAVLLVGAAVTVGFSYFFGLPNLRAQALMTAALSGSVALNLFLIAALDYPFTGDVRVMPEAFQEAIAVFDRMDAIAAAGGRDGGSRSAYQPVAAARSGARP